jgi:hypothetical protein
MDVISTSASLRMFTDEMGLDFISIALGVQPTRQHLKGERRSVRNPQSSLFEQSVWIHDSGLPDSSELHEHVDCILKLLESECLGMARIRARISQIDIFCMFSSEHGQGSAELNAGLLRRLADQNVTLLLDLYPPS